jgi:hypothetical protein
LDYGLEEASVRHILNAAQLESGDWPDDLVDRLSASVTEVCLANLLDVPPRTTTLEVDGKRLRDRAAVASRLLSLTTSNTKVVTILPLTTLTSHADAAFREWVIERFEVSWIVYAGREEARRMTAHPEFRFVLVVLERKPEKESTLARLLRLVNLGEIRPSQIVDRTRWAARREGGEVGSTIVVRDPALDREPWTYDRFSKRFAALRDDASALGRVVSLSDLVESLSLGLRRAVDAEHFGVLDADVELPKGALPCFSFRSVQLDERLGETSRFVRPTMQIRPEAMLQDGDLLIRRMNGPDGRVPIVACQVRAFHVPATFDDSCIRLRFRDEIPDSIRRVIQGYLRSEHVRVWLRAHGAAINLTPTLLKSLEVPYPSTEVFEAMEKLREAEEQYRSWADLLSAIRSELFVSGSFREQVPFLLDRQRVESERLRAARDSEGLDYQVRNYFPHPLAVRRERVLTEDQPRKRVSNILECAEFLVHFLALMGMQQSCKDELVMQTPPSPAMRYFFDGKSLSLDWGRSFSVLSAALDFSARNAEPLTLRYPDLFKLGSEFRENGSRWKAAEDSLRDHRNSESHLQRVPESDLDRLADELQVSLDILFEGAAFLAMVPLVRIVDYERDAATGQRRASFEYLQGLSPVFRRERKPVSEELPRGAVGLIDRQGNFNALTPWLTMEVCEVCRRSEIFSFSRIEAGKPTYVAMETGHALDVDRYREMLLQMMAQCDE